MASRDSDFEDLMARVRSGEDAAETVVFRRFVHRLIALAGRQFDSWMHEQADVENVVLSAYKSFFLRNQREEFDLAGWDALWSLLVVITLHKCTKRRKHLRAARRDMARQVPWPEQNERVTWLPDRAPTPDEAAILTDTVEALFQTMMPDDRPIVEQILMGYTAQQVAIQLGCSERTVRRVRERAQRRLERLADPQETGRPGARTRD
jgi:DNA-directed RNA polymerase specialized sigma24 family protein